MHRINQTKNPPIAKPLKMTCDKPLRPGIPFSLPNRGGARFLVVGSPGNGKMNWAVSQLIKGGAYHHVFDSPHLVMPPNSRASFADGPFEHHNKNYSELTPEVLNKTLTDVKKKQRRQGGIHAFSSMTVHT